MILTLSWVFLVLRMSRVAVVWLRSFPAAEASSGRSQPSVSATTDVSPAWSTSRRSPGHRRLCPSRLRRRNCTVEVSISVRSTPWPVLRLPLLLLTHPVSVIRTSYDYRLTLRKWVSEHCFTSPPTQYRLYGIRFLQVIRPNQQYQSTTKYKENNGNN